MIFSKRDTKEQIETSLDFAPKFDEKGLIPVITTDHKSGAVLTLAYMNEESLRKTLETREAWYWSRSRQELWHKGATSGHIQHVLELRVDCDQDALWMIVDPVGDIACHLGHNSCFHRTVTFDASEKTTKLSANSLAKH